MFRSKRSQAAFRRLLGERHLGLLIFKIFNSRGCCSASSEITSGEQNAYEHHISILLFSFPGHIKSSFIFLLSPCSCWHMGLDFV